MKFLTEQALDILINKYKKSDPGLVFTKSGIILLGVDNKSASLRLPPIRSKKYFINSNQIAEFDDYIYFPADQVEELTDEYVEYTKPIKSQYMKKWDWLQIKRNYPYKGRD